MGNFHYNPPNQGVNPEPLGSPLCPFLLEFLEKTHIFNHLWSFYGPEKEVGQFWEIFVFDLPDLGFEPGTSGFKELGPVMSTNNLNMCPLCPFLLEIVRERYIFDHLWLFYGPEKELDHFG